MVPSVDQVDIMALARHARLIAFDLDNTLACSKQPMEPGMASRLSRLTRLIDVAIVTGGSQQLAFSQVLDVLDEDACRGRMHVMPTSGTRYYRWNGHDWHLEFCHRLSEDARRRTLESLERRAREQGMWLERVWGERIEDRGSQITFSALGQDAPAWAKQQFDHDGDAKRALAQAVQRDLPDLSVRPGGYTSVDVSAKGINKAYAVRELANMLGIEVKQIVFVGDRMGPDGNDYPAVAAGAIGIRVNGPADTEHLCDMLMDALR